MPLLKKLKVLIFFNCSDACRTARSSAEYNTAQTAIYQTLPFCSFFQKVPFLSEILRKHVRLVARFAIHPTHPSPHQPTQRRNLTYQCFCTKNKKMDHSNKKLSLVLPKEQNKTKQNIIPFLSDPGLIIVYPCQSLTDSLTN